MIKNRIKQLLEEREKSLYWLAKETGISYTTLHKIGKGTTDRVYYSVLDKICGALDCQPGDLLVYESDGKKKGGKAK